MIGNLLEVAGRLDGEEEARYVRLGEPGAASVFGMAVEENKRDCFEGFPEGNNPISMGLDGFLNFDGDLKEVAQVA